MTKQTITLRAALGKKKLLDKQIEKIVKGENFVVATLASSEVIGGLPVADWQNHVLATFQSLNDKIRYREALSVAIMKANVTNTIKLPQFVSFSFDDTKTEELTFASAIARKQYYTNVLLDIIDTLMRKSAKQTDVYKDLEKEREKVVSKRMTEEFAGVNNVSSKTKEERETRLREIYAPVLLDPCQLNSKLRLMKESIENYLETIDSLLGAATEVTTIEVEM